MDPTWIFQIWKQTGLYSVTGKVSISHGVIKNVSKLKGKKLRIHDLFLKILVMQLAQIFNKLQGFFRGKNKE